MKFLLFIHDKGMVEGELNVEEVMNNLDSSEALDEFTYWYPDATKGDYIEFDKYVIIVVGVKED